ncbi:MAG: sulfite exporter TauE/SafE family protein [Desulfomonilaceae bacterium]
MTDLAMEGAKFIDLTWMNVSFLFIVGFIGGLVSGFIGSGGAFVLTPGMMSLGVPAAVAVASNMCHKFPKAMVGAYKRYKYGQVDLKLGLVMAASATVGVQAGIKIQEMVLSKWGEAGSNLYVSVSFVLVLLVVGGYVFYDAWKTSGSEASDKPSGLAERLQRINIPPMIYFKTANIRISLWFTIPVGFATGALAATIAVGGFVGVPGMIYVVGAGGLIASATELVIAFLMGLGGSIKWAIHGMVDIRLTLIILAGSLLGVQLGAIGTTYVKEHMIKVVMGTIMLIVAFSRALAIPKYLEQLSLISTSKSVIYYLDIASFATMCLALAIGAVIILGSMWKARQPVEIFPPKISESY